MSTSRIQPQRQALGARIGKFVKFFLPRLDEYVWLRQRKRAVRESTKHLAGSREALLGAVTRSSPIHVVVVIHHGPDVNNYHVAGQNIFFEIQQSLKEKLGPEAVTIFGVAPDEAPTDWHSRLLSILGSTRATHLISQIETDPNQPDCWTWDVVAATLADSWDGTWIGVMFDAAYPWLRIRARRLGRLNDRLLIADLGGEVTGIARPSRVEAGPVTMPISEATIQAILDYTGNAPKLYDVSFIGALYDYRVDLLTTLAESGLNVVQNPHRSDSPTTYDESRANQPSYLDFMMGLAQSQMTLNFSRANVGDSQQYKIRIVEAALVGCLPITDDIDLTDRFFDPMHFDRFTDIDTLKDVLQLQLRDGYALRRRQHAAQSRAQDLAQFDFWRRIDQVAVQRNLRPLFPEDSINQSQPN